MSIAGDSVWVMSRQDDAERARQLLQHDRRVLQPGAAARRRRAAPTTGRGTWYSSLYNSGYVYYPALDVHLGHADTATHEPPRPPGPRVVPASRRVDDVGAHEPLPGPSQHEVGRRDARLLRRGGALRADQPRLQFDADRQQLRHARTSSNTGNQWASFMLGALDNQTSARLVPLQNAVPARLRRVFPGRLRVSATA